jgi:hypothetical protein
MKKGRAAHRAPSLFCSSRDGPRADLTRSQDRSGSGESGRSGSAPDRRSAHRSGFRASAAGLPSCLSCVRRENAGASIACRESAGIANARTVSGPGACVTIARQPPCFGSIHTLRLLTSGTLAFPEPWPGGAVRKSVLDQAGAACHQAAILNYQFTGWLLSGCNSRLRRLSAAHTLHRPGSRSRHQRQIWGPARWRPCHTRPGRSGKP